MPKFKSGDVLIFRQLDVTDSGTRYVAMPLKIKRVRTGGTLQMEISGARYESSYPVLRDAPNISAMNVGCLNSTTYPDGLCVWCYTAPLTDVSGLKRLMAAKLHELIVKQSDALRRKIDKVVSWGSMVRIPSPETSEMNVIIEEEYK